MKKILIALTALALALPMGVRAQELPIPNASFEQWSSHSGYSVSVFIFSLPIYNAFSSPSQWNYLTYPVNETVSYSGLNVNVNTDLPLLKVSNVTDSVTDGNTAVKLQTFMVEDIMTSTAYSLASGSIDPTMISTIYPTVLSTGEVDLMAFMPYMNTVLDNMNNIPLLASMFDGEDLDTIVSGGIALGSFQPTRLTGSYKYHSAVAGDNGGVALIGTRYNNATHRREVAGVGCNVALTDTDAFTSFTVNYVPRHLINPTCPEVDADTLIVLLVSSANNNNRQQGSYLILDDLHLWQDTCANIQGLDTISVDAMYAYLAWQADSSVQGYEVEYGLQGFALGTGINSEETYAYVALMGLIPNTTYDFYVRTHCGGNIYGEWSQISFHTQASQVTCVNITGLHTVSVEEQMATIAWDYGTDVLEYEVEYGQQGFSLGTGTNSAVSYPTVTLNGLTPDTDYDLYVRSRCYNNVYGNWSQIQFHTLALPDTCADIEDLHLVDVDEVSATIAWDANPDVQGYEVEYGIWQFALGTGTNLEVTDTFAVLAGLQSATSYNCYVRTHCHDDVYGEWSYISFATPSEPDTCGSIYDFVATEVGQTSATLSWQAYGIPDSYQFEYGLSDTPFGSGQQITLAENGVVLNELIPETDYRCYVRSSCHDDVFGDWSYTEFSTLPISQEGIDEATELGFGVYPNPANGMITVQSAQNGEISLYSADGRCLQRIILQGSATLSLPQDGVYFVVLTTPDATCSRKVVNCK